MIHVFADPNPEPGDEFGAALAVVGNDLLVGAPGSSLSGPGDGVAYLFDANPESPTFGDLLATLTIPDPGAAMSHFGAAVGAANTKIVIGAPGKDGGSGEVFEFEGDPTQPNFGSLLLDIGNPDFTARLRLRRGRRGAGRQRDRRGAVRQHRGRGPASSTCSTARPAPSHADRRPQRRDVDRLRLGGGVGRVEHPDRLAAGQRRRRRGVPVHSIGDRRTALAHDVRPARRRRRPLRRVGGGQQHTALIGAPGANLGTSDAGAAYLFDANPSSPTFGQRDRRRAGAHARHGRRLRHRGRLRRHGGLDRRRGAAAPGPRPPTSISPAPRSRVSATTTYATAAPYDSVIVSGTFVVAEPFDTLTGSINWGDGSAPTLLNLPPGSYAFSVPHDYTTDPAPGPTRSA